MVNKEQVLDALRAIKNNEDQDIVALGIVSGLILKGDNVGFALEVDAANIGNMEKFRKTCENAVKKIKGIKKVTAVLTTTRVTATNNLDAENSNSKAPSESKDRQPVKRNKQPLPNIKKIILVASGKGGVGKSSVATNLAVALTRTGYKIGLLDADIYGPSIPKMLHVTEKPTIDGHKRIVPLRPSVLEKNSLDVMSMGFLIEEGKAVVWRGPMATKALYQLFHGVAWENIDYMIVDMPPGTGDIQISIAENFEVAGAIMVSTPQEVALLDVKKAIDMFNKVRVPIIGIVENMSYFEDPVSGNRSYIFGKHGAKSLAERENIEFFGEIPILTSIAESGDSGKPVSIDPSTMIGAVFDEIALKIINRCPI